MTRKATPNVLEELMDRAPAAQPAPAGHTLAPLEKLLDNPYQSRLSDDPAHIVELARSIARLRPDLPATLGLQQPPLGRLVRAYGDGNCEVFDRYVYSQPRLLADLLREDDVFVQLGIGHSRKMAFHLLAYGLAAVFPDLAEPAGGFPAPDAAYERMPVNLVFATDAAMWQHVATENAQRKNLNPIEEATLLKRALDVLGLTTEQAGHTLGLSRSAAANKLRLLNLPDAARAALIAGQLTERHGRELLRLAPAPFYFDQALDQALKNDLPVAKLEQEITRAIRSRTPVPEQPAKMHEGPWASTPQTFPPPWDVDWTPETDSPRVLGACRTCRYWVQFTGEEGRRCTQPHGMNRSIDETCAWIKRDLWRQRSVAAQRAALEAQAAEPVSQETPTPAAPAPAPAAPIYTEYDNRYCYFGDFDAPRHLIDAGHCGPGLCPCYAVAYRQHPRPDSHVIPDPQNAPNLCACCTDKKALDAKLRPIRAAEHRQAQADDAAAWQIIIEALAAIGGPAAAFADPIFIADVCANVHELRADKKDLWAAFVRLVYGSQISQWRDGTRFASLEKARAIAARLRRQPEP